jgi:cobalt/nickel transport system permease protein
MHIPDGYLSPSTCAVLYAGAGVGWYGSLRRVRQTFTTRLIPLISVFAAFSFVLMMFNLPLPGGTTGHAIGVTIAAVILGPSGSILAISIAIAIQALFFGDGGITTLGANCFNMAIVGSLVAYATYRLIAAGAVIPSRRRVAAAAIAGYLAANAAAFVAAIEFGIQPMLFHNANGVPLYAPYPLGVAIPAMMIGHLMVAGIAEAVIAAGLVAYLQVADPGLLHSTSGLPKSVLTPEPVPQKSLRKLWITVALLMLFTPLGILAGGTAWGEWSARQASASAGNAAALSPGLQRFSDIWTAPIPNYAPQFVKSPSFGYLLSAMFGVGLLIVSSLLVQRLVQRQRTSGQP